MWLGKIFFTFFLITHGSQDLKKKKIAEHCSPRKSNTFMRYKHKENTEHLKTHHYNSHR